MVKRSEAARRDFGMIRILLAEDDRVMREYLTRALERSGYAVVAVDRGTAAIPLLETEHFDLLLTDIVMPEMDGIETLKRIREHYRKHNKPSVPEIVVTAYADASKEQEARNLGVSSFFHKPFVVNEFLKS